MLGSLGRSSECLCQRSWYDFLISHQFKVESSDSHKVGSHQWNLLYLVWPCTKWQEQEQDIGNPSSIFWMSTLMPIPDLPRNKGGDAPKGDEANWAAIFSFCIRMAFFKNIFYTFKYRILLRAYQVNEPSFVTLHEVLPLQLHPLKTLLLVPY